MPSSRYPLIAREGWPFLFLAAALGVAAFAFLGWPWSLPLWGLVLVLLYLFRDPRREIPPNPLGVVSPADGVVRSIGKVHDPFLKRDAIRIAIDMSPYGSYTTRSPVEGKIIDMLEGGEGMPHGVWLKTDEDDDLVVVMFRGPLHNAPRCYVRCGERIGQGQRCGFVHMGARIELYLPPNSRIRVEEGQRVQGGSDLVATLVHK